MKISKTKASILSTLSSKKMRLKHNLFLAEGVKCAIDMLGAYELVNIVATEEWLETYPVHREWTDGVVLTAEPETMKKISSLSTPPEVIAVFRLPDEEAVVTLERDKFYLMLDGVQDPGNLGTIIRTADWFGFDYVICSRDTVDVYNPKTIQATMGSLKRVKVVYADLIDVIEDSGITHVYGTMLEGDNIFKRSLEAPGVIVMGNEGKGLSERMRQLVTDPLYIPPTNPASHGESLNVAIASAIVMAQFRNSF